MREPAQALPVIAKPEDALPAWTEAARMYHDLADRLRLLQCTLLTQSVATINGARPKPREACTKSTDEDIRK